jgi:hypothetical protein
VEAVEASCFTFFQEVKVEVEAGFFTSMEEVEAGFTSVLEFEVEVEAGCCGRK